VNVEKRYGMRMCLGVRTFELNYIIFDLDIGKLFHLDNIWDMSESQCHMSKVMVTGK